MMTTLIPQLNAFDVQGLHQLNDSRLTGNTALKSAADQFEAIFFRQLLSSMRKVNDLFKADSIFDSKTSDFYQGMWDDQISLNLSKGSAGSISDLLVQQLGGVNKNKIEMKTVPPATAVVNNNQNIKTAPKTLLFNNNKTVSEWQAEVSAKQNKVINTPIEKAPNIEPESFSSPASFIGYLKPLVRQASEILGIKPQFLLAQSALETGWGKLLIKSKIYGNSKNLFNIKDKKAWQGKTAVKTSVEFDGVNFKQQQSTFRVYDSFKQSVDDFVKFISNDIRYQPMMENGQNQAVYLQKLQDSGYATDPEYASKISKILQTKIMQESFNE